jgi:hypothetical protein
VAAKPFNHHALMAVSDGCNQPVIISLYVEYNAFRGNNTGRAELSF